MTDDKVTAKDGVRGHITLWQVDDKTGLKVPVGDQPNQIQYSWGFIAAKQIGYRPNPERLHYNISAVYLEFENQIDPETEISAEPFSRDIGIGYYNALIDNPTRDFLRIPLIIEPAGGVSPGYEANLPTEQQLNKLTFFVQSVGTSGVHGKQFTHASLNGTTNVAFTLNNSTISAKDVVLVNVAGGTASNDTYNCWVSGHGTGSCTIVLRNISGGALSEAVVINFAVIHCT